MKTFRSICWALGFLVFCFGACCGETPGYLPYIIVLVGLVIMGLGILVDILVSEEEAYEDEDDM